MALRRLLSQATKIPLQQATRRRLSSLSPKDFIFKDSIERASHHNQKVLYGKEANPRAVVKAEIERIYNSPITQASAFKNKMHEFGYSKKEQLAIISLMFSKGSGTRLTWDKFNLSAYELLMWEIKSPAPLPNENCLFYQTAVSYLGSYDAVTWKERLISQALHYHLVTVAGMPSDDAQLLTKACKQLNKPVEPLLAELEKLYEETIAFKKTPPQKTSFTAKRLLYVSGTILSTYCLYLLITDNTKKPAPKVNVFSEAQYYFMAEWLTGFLSKQYDLILTQEIDCLTFEINKYKYGKKKRLENYPVTKEQIAKLASILKVKISSLKLENFNNVNYIEINNQGSYDTVPPLILESLEEAGFPAQDFRLYPWKTFNMGDNNSITFNGDVIYSKEKISLINHSIFQVKPEETVVTPLVQPNSIDYKR